MRIGWILAGVLIVGGGAFAAIIKVKKDRERAARVAHETEVTDFANRMRALRVNEVAADAEAAIRLAQERKSLWENEETIAAEISAIDARAKGFLDAQKERTELMERLAQTEEKLKSASSLSPEEITELKRRLDDLEVKAIYLGAEVVARVGVGQSTLGRADVERSRKDADDFATANPDKPLPVLHRYGEAEDKLLGYFERSILARNKDDEAFFKTHYQEVQKAADAIATKTFTDDYISKVQPKDLLSGVQATYWNAAQAPGFSHRVEGGALTMQGPDPGSQRQGVITIGDREKWRDFVAEMEFTMEKGKVDMAVRVGKRVDSTIQYLDPLKVGDDLAANVSHRLRFGAIGSKAFSKLDDQDERSQDPIKWTFSRKGAIAFIVDEGARIRVTRMRVWELR